MQESGAEPGEQNQVNGVLRLSRVGEQEARAELLGLGIKV